MIRVRLFRLEKAIGIIRLEEARHRVRPEGVLGDESVAVIRKDLERGRIDGMVGLCHWYRQATPFCPLDSARLCPCDDEICRADAIPA